MLTAQFGHCGYVRRVTIAAIGCHAVLNGTEKGINAGSGLNANDQANELPLVAKAFAAGAQKLFGGYFDLTAVAFDNAVRD